MTVHKIYAECSDMDYYKAFNDAFRLLVHEENFRKAPPAKQVDVLAKLTGVLSEISGHLRWGSGRNSYNYLCKRIAVGSTVTHEHWDVKVVYDAHCAAVYSYSTCTAEELGLAAVAKAERLVKMKGSV